jgi:hypothetical protein
MAKRSFEFSVGEWIRIADCKLTKRLKSSSLDERARRRAEKRYQNDLRDIYILRRLVDWGSKRGIKVLFKTTTRDFQCGRMIYINRRLSVQEQVTSLLHEYGHFLMMRDSEAYSKKYAYGYRTDDSVELPLGYPKIRSDLVYRASVVAEECEAWERGFRLAKRLNLRIDRRRFEISRSQCLKEYFIWGAKASYKSKHSQPSGITLKSKKKTSSFFSSVS